MKIKHYCRGVVASIGFLFSLSVFSPFVYAQESAPTYRLETVVTGIAIPWGMVQLPDGNLLVTERSGSLFYADLNRQQKTKISGLPTITARGQGGLLDIALHPDYQNNGWIYLSYSSPDGGASGDNTAIVRARLKDFALVDLQQLYKATPNSSKTQHFGSRLAFDKEGYLYFSIGDRGERDVNPQDITLDGGKIYRLHDDGRIPKDNPFVDVKGAKTAIYSYGHRNPQGMALHPLSGDIWTHEHGPRGGDEINIIGKGKNYGWPEVTYGINYYGTSISDFTSKPGMEQPVWYWDPSIAPSGMAFVTSERYPNLKGQLLVGSLKFGTLVACQLAGNRVDSANVLLENLARVRDVRQMADGFIYIATEDNRIVRLVP
jgi:aldose sugar dehydrogenase